MADKEKDIIVNFSIDLPLSMIHDLAQHVSHSYLRTNDLIYHILCEYLKPIEPKELIEPSLENFRQLHRAFVNNKNEDPHGT